MLKVGTPAPLCDAGLVQRLGARNTSDLPFVFHDSQRASVTGVIGFLSLCATTSAIWTTVTTLTGNEKGPS